MRRGIGARGPQGVKMFAFFALELNKTADNVALGEKFAAFGAMDVMIFVLHTL